MAAPARAELVIEITRGAVKPIPIAIVPFGWSGSGSAPGDAASVIRSDLFGSGRFDPLPNDDMLERPVRGVDIDFDNWRLVAVDYVLVGRLEQVGDELALTYQLFDVYGARQVVADSLVLEPRDLRLASHRVADAVFEHETVGDDLACAVD
ncbi:MAG: Tol-Pal system protein TolB, partial [Pseudomonadota bacterium]